jgi:hypothetical protein
MYMPFCNRVRTSLFQLGKILRRSRNKILNRLVVDSKLRVAEYSITGFEEEPRTRMDSYPRRSSYSLGSDMTFSSILVWGLYPTFMPKIMFSFKLTFNTIAPVYLQHVAIIAPGEVGPLWLSPSCAVDSSQV